MAKTVIDISKWNTIKDYSKLAKAADGVIIRIGYRSSSNNGKIIEDPLFFAHVVKLQKEGVPLGFYFFTEAITMDEAKEEADWVLNMIKKYNITISFPIAIDTEWCNKSHTGRSDKLSVAARTNCVVAFCETIMTAGYQTMIYASDSWFKSNLNYAGIKPYNKWVARYGNKPSVSDNVLGWQKSESYTISGLSGKFDLSEWYGEISEAAAKYKYTSENTTDSVKKESVKQSSTSAIELKNAALYSSSTGNPVARKLTGIYYIWSPEVKNGRIRVTTKEEYIGQPGKVSGWIDKL